MAVAIGVGMLLPVALGLLARAPGRIGETLFVICSGLGVIGLSSGVANLFAAADIVWLAVVIAGMLGWSLITRSEGVQSALHLLAFSPLVVVSAFLLTTPSGRLVLHSEAPEMVAPRTEARVPVVVVVFDEFPLTSLVDSDGAFRSDWFPSFDRLRREGVWFRNAVTVSTETDKAVPSLLTGRVATPSQQPILSDHPQSLFTMARFDAALAHEPITQMCPTSVCVSTRQQRSPGQRLSTMVSDLVVVTAHSVLPPTARLRLPNIDQGWGEFAAVAVNKGERDRMDQLDRFIAATAVLPSDADDPLLFLHLLLPHLPLQHLPNGQLYEEPPGLSIPEGSDLEALLVQRHLLQAVHTDAVLGELLEQLERNGLYDKAMMVHTDGRDLLADEPVTVPAFQPPIAPPDIRDWYRQGPPASIDAWFPDGDLFSLQPATSGARTGMLASHLVGYRSIADWSLDEVEMSPPAGLVTGSVGAGNDSPTSVAMAIDGVVAGITRTYRSDGEWRFAMMVNPEIASQGAGVISLLSSSPD